MLYGKSQPRRKAVPLMVPVLTRVQLGLLLCLASACWNAHATINVSPLRIQMAPATGVTSIEISNGDFTANVVVQITTYLWTEIDGERELSLTTDLIAQPNVLKIPPGDSRSVILRSASTAQPPRYYRIKVEEVPKVSDNTQSGVKFGFAYNLPVFFDDVASPESIIVDTSISIDNKTADITLSNSGKKYYLATGFTLTNTQIVDGININADVAGHANGQHYVLPGQTVSVQLALDNISGLQETDSLFQLDILGKQGTSIRTEVRRVKTGELINFPGSE